MLFSKRTWLVFATGMATAAILLIVVFPQGQTSVSQLAEHAFHGTDQSGGKDFQKFVSKEQADLKNLQGIFSNRLKAVVRSQDSTQYVLAEEEEKSQPIAEQPVFLEITKNGAKTQITTFSGETVQFDSSDEDSKMEVMLTPEGNVLIVGPNFVWKSDSRQPLKVPGNDGVVKIQAKPLRGI